jgi:hypothetical protein
LLSLDSLNTITIIHTVKRQGGEAIKLNGKNYICWNKNSWKYLDNNVLQFKLDIVGIPVGINSNINNYLISESQKGNFITDGNLWEVQSVTFPYLRKQCLLQLPE